MNFLRDPGLHLPDSSGEVSAAHTELHRDIAAAILAIDHESAFAQGNVGHLGERNAAAVRRGQQDVANRFGSAAEFRLIANDEVEATITFEDLRRGKSADGCLNRGIQVRSHQTVPGTGGAVDGNQKLRLARFLKDAKIGDAANSRHDVLDLTCLFNQHIDIVAKYLQGILALYAGHGLFYVVLNI